MRLRFLSICLLALCLPLLSPESSAGFRIRSVTIQGQTHLLLRDTAAFYGMQYLAGETAAVLSSRYSRLVFQDKLRAATINGVQVHLSEACTKWRNELTVSETDFRLILEPILRSRTLRPRPIETIVLDPGHGGRDPGARNSHVDEKEINLAVAKRLSALLKKSGYRVYLTRTGDQARSLDARAAAAGRVGADLFISLHANAVGAASVNGVETYLLTPEGTASTYGNSRKTEASPGNAYNTENSRLAYEIQKEIIAATGARDRGAKHADFMVLRKIPCAGVLVEMGFLTNGPEAAKLAQPAYQQRLAVGIARGIRRFHRAVLE